MPQFISALLAWLGPVLVSSFGKFLAALGIGVVSFAGVSLLTDQVMQYVSSNTGGVPVVVMQFVHMFKLITAINMVCSAYAGKFAVEGLKRFVIK